MNILLVQPYEDYKFIYQKLYEQILKIINKHNVDLVVFPEAFIEVKDNKEARDIVEDIADFLYKPVLCGMSYADGTERALYFNCTPSDGETSDSIFIKHSTAKRVAFDLGIQELEDLKVYNPILLNGQRIQTYICHDMFFPLITERLEEEEIDILINLTGGNVKMSKWCNVLKGRSIELDSFVLCTMANRKGEKQPSDRIAFHGGEKLTANFKQGSGLRSHAFSIFSTTQPIQEIEADETIYSDKQYQQFTVGFDETSDCTIDREEMGVYSRLPIAEEYEGSLCVVKDKETIHVHIADYEEIFERTYLYNEPRSEGEHHIIIYLTDKPINEKEAIAMLKLRVIENRIGCIVVGKEYLIGAKTNRYKDVQLFKSTDNKIGFELQFMQGIDSIFQKSVSTTQGIPLNFKEDYLALGAKKHDRGSLAYLK